MTAFGHCTSVWILGELVTRKILLTFLIACWQVSSARALPDLREGDLIFQTSLSSQSIAVQKATGSPYSHMGVVLAVRGSLCVFEASVTVMCTPIRQWIARGKNGHYVVKRIKSEALLDSPENLKRLRATAESFSGLPYDLTFEWDDSRMYCSELVWKLFNRAFGISIGGLSQLRDFDLTSAAVKKKIEERYNGQPPLEESVISPKAMFDSSLLVEVVRK
jgi:Permuted papain-like amidase enzyme, YaeF/YiiX, C92 family